MKHVFLSTVGERRETKYITLSLMRSMSTKRFMKKTKIATKRQKKKSTPNEIIGYTGC